MEFETNFSTGIEELGSEIHHVLRSIGSLIQAVEVSFHLNRVDSLYQEMSNPSEAGWSIVESEGHGRPLEEASFEVKPVLCRSSLLIRIFQFPHYKSKEHY